MSDHEPCCAACGGAGADMSGPCSDCYGTGCAHPPMSSVDRAAEVLIAHRRWRIQDCACGWAKPGKSHTEHVVQCLDAAGALVTPAHDAAVIEKFLRERDTPSVRIENPDMLFALVSKSLHMAADEMDAVIADGDSAEVAAPVQGEVGRATVVERRDALYEDPGQWLRDYAERKYRKGETDDRR